MKEEQYQFVLSYQILISDIFRRHYLYFPTLNLLIENIRKIEKLKRDIINENRIKNNPKAILY